MKNKGECILKRILIPVLTVCLFLCACTEPTPSVGVTGSELPSQSIESKPTNTPQYTLSPIITVSQTPVSSAAPTPSVNSTPSVKPTPSATPTPSVMPTPSAVPTPSVMPTPSTTPDEGYGSATVNYPVKSDGSTYTGAEPLDEMTYTVYDPENKRELSESSTEFSFGLAKNGVPSNTTVNNQKRFDSTGYDILAWDNKTSTNEKVLYLTFDCGYKYEDLMERILDTLKEKEVSATFFCTMQYIKNAPEEITRIIKEGHIVGNHTANHPSNCAKISREALAMEILGVNNYLRVKFGYDCKYFRFPAGVYSTSSLELADSLGCRSVFWSVAHRDWDPKNQPGEDVSFETVTSRLHPGAVILLHSTSPDNAAILGRFIDYARDNGYTFRSLDEYAYWNN